MTTSPDIASPQTLARRICLVREARRLSQGDVGLHAGVDQSYVSRLEAGSISSPGLLQVSSIARTLGIDLWTLAGGDDAAFDQGLARIASGPGAPTAQEETLADLAGREGVALGNFAEMGKNILIVGHTACGKTRIARAVARRMRGKATYISTDGDTRTGPPAIIQIDQRLLGNAIRTSAQSAEGIVIDSLPTTWLTGILDSAAGVDQLVCVCAVKKLREGKETDAQLLQSVAQKLRSDGRAIAETFDYLVRTERVAGGGCGMKVLEFGLEPTLSPVIGR